MPRYVDADKLHYKRVWIAAAKDGAVKDAVVVFAKEIDTLALPPRTTDVVEVVRCQDCRFANWIGSGFCTCHNEDSAVYLGCVPEDWYCADGEREENKNQ